MMEPVESLERVIEGLKKAADRARTLGKLQKGSHWNSFAFSLDQLRQTAQELYDAKPLNRQAALAMIDRMVAKNAIQPGSDKVQ